MMRSIINFYINHVKKFCDVMFIVVVIIALFSIIMTIYELGKQHAYESIAKGEYEISNEKVFKNNKLYSSDNWLIVNKGKYKIKKE